MKSHLIKKTEVLYNGNLEPETAPCYGLEHLVNEVELGDGRKKKAFLNSTKQEVLLKKGYRGNSGLCDDLILQPGEGLYVISKGTGYSFAAYQKFMFINTK